MKRAIIKRIKQLSIALALVMAIPITVLAFSPPTIPLLVNGQASIDGEPAVGAVISAAIGNVEVSSTVATSEGKYSIKIPDGKANEDKVITFKINGIIVEDADSQYRVVNIIATPIINFDLAVATPPAASPAGGGGGGGGGGSPPPQNPPASPEAVTGDANGDQKVDLLDFNTLMINWGKTEANNIADFNQDGKVDIFDFNLLMINWAV